ncbi:MAG: M28 family peptidase [Leptolyngbyaceae cyanobacterium SL_7_1]|nr:M28 family peptidase [Leptolyngbyaceae cyanobacterium SL_7_1]
MRNVRNWLALFLITLLGVLIGWHWQWFSSLPLGTEVDWRSLSSDFLQETDVPLNARRAIETPTINSDRLFADLQSLSVPRFTEADRANTRAYLVQSLQAAGWQPETLSYDTGVNLVATRLGTDPTAGTILVGAHYDTVARSPGADDNATAVAAVLEIARVFQTPTPATLQIALFDQEEVGLLGSVDFSRHALREDLRGAVILEMLGYACYREGCQSYPAVLPITPPTNRGDFLAVIGDQGHTFLIDSFTRSTQADLPQVLTLAIPLLGPLTPDLLRSDHAPFWQEGIGAVMVTDTANFRNPHYHESTDTPETIDRPFFSGSVQLVANALAELLNPNSPS